MRALFFAVLILCGSCQSQSVSSGSTRQASQQKLPLSKGSFRPKLSLQDALKLAEEYVHETHIAISDYWLCEARFITFGDQTKSDQQPAWFFWWQKENGGMGDYVELVVFMNGKIRRMPSM